MDKTVQQQVLTGEVMNVTEKTARIKVGRTKMHPIYRKRYSVHTNLLAHIPDGVTIETGNTVSITRTRPLSKRKRWIVVSTT